jgi:hypothetical protein
MPATWSQPSRPSEEEVTSMKKLIALSIVAGVLIASPALASQCPALVKQIDAQAGNRFDATAQNARQAGAKAAKLHAEGKHAESMKTAQDALATLQKK